MNCEDLLGLLNRQPDCAQTLEGARLLTHCLYPSSDPVEVYVQRSGEGFRVSDGGGAWRSAVLHGCATLSMFDDACKLHSVEEQGGVLLALPPNADWLYPAVLAVSNASAMAARVALEVASDRLERTLNREILAKLALVVPAHRIARNFEYRGRSGHLWPIDFAVLDDRPRLIKSVVQNGNSINSNYATFGDIGEESDVVKYSVFSSPLKEDSSLLLQQVAVLLPLQAVPSVIGRSGLAH